jgi:hypothetical protein
MNKFQILSQINKDIELLESFGDIKSANILHTKFLKVSQFLVSEKEKSREDLMDEFFLLAQNPNDDFEKLVEWYESDPGRYSEEDRAYIDEAVKKATDQRKRLGKFTTVINPDNPTLVSVENESVDPNGNGTSNKSEDTSVKSTGPKLPILDKREQGYVYRRIVKQIKRLLKENKKERADKLALDYQDFFENPGTNEDFITQVNRIYRELKKASPLPMM